MTFEKKEINIVKCLQSVELNRKRDVHPAGPSSQLINLLLMMSQFLSFCLRSSDHAKAK